MATVQGKKSDNVILRKLFQKAELSYALSDLSKAVGPIVDLAVISLFIGPNGVTVLGYVAPLIILFELIGTAVSSGSRNKVSALIGAGDVETANRAFSGAIIVGGGSALLVALLIYAFGPAVTFVLGARDPQIAEMTRQYIFGYLIGFPFFTLTRILTPYLQMEGEYRRVTLTSMLTTIIDILSDLFVVFVLHGGMFEIGLATSLGYVLPFFVGALYFFGRNKRSVFRFSFKGFSPKLCGEIVGLGAPAGIVKGSNFLGGLLINNMLTAMKVQFLVAAYGVFSQITAFVRSAWCAPDDALHAFAGVFIGEEDRDSLKKIQKMAVLHALVYSGAAAVLIFALAAPLSSIFLKTDDPVAFRMSVECLRVACFCLPFHAIVYNFNNYLMAVKRLRFCYFYSFLIECGTLAPITFCALRVFGYHGAWIAKVINMLVLSAIAVAYIAKYGQGDSFTDKMLLLPRDFGFSPENEIAVTATSTKELLNLSRVATAFAAEHGAGKDRARYFGMVIEEMAGIEAEHGFNDGKPHTINTRLIAKDGDLIIRMRDDCKPFNLEEYHRLIQESQDKEGGFGVMIIFNAAKDAKYISTFGANNLILRI